MMISRIVALFCLYGITIVFGNSIQRFQDQFNPDKDIIDGEDATNGEFPWHISLQRQTTSGAFEHICGGSILDSTHVLTAAHCIFYETAAKTYIVAGAHNISATEASQQRIQVKVFTPHEEYDNDFLYNDIAILELVSQIRLDQFSKVAVLCQADPPDDAAVVITGWGYANVEENGPLTLPGILQKVTVEVLNRQTCAELYPGLVTEQTVCVLGSDANPNGSGCDGDSGGPLHHLVSGANCVAGIASFADKPCGSGATGFASVPYFSTWIASHT